MNLIKKPQVSAEWHDLLAVLRKTKGLASKLDRRHIPEWLQNEKGGYSGAVDVPQYRR